METKDILLEYPFLTKKQVEAVIIYARNLVRKEESYIFDKINIKRA
jgi:uncharacterized protein (DUF433 family)